MTLARGATDALGQDGWGVAVIYDYVFGPGAHATAALQLGPSGSSRLLPADQAASTIEVFRHIVDAMLNAGERLIPVDQLDELVPE